MARLNLHGSCNLFLYFRSVVVAGVSRRLVRMTTDLGEPFNRQHVWRAKLPGQPRLEEPRFPYGAGNTNVDSSDCKRFRKISKRIGCVAVYSRCRGNLPANLICFTFIRAVAFRMCVFTLVSTSLAFQSQAQSISEEPLVVPFFPTPPFAQFDADGQRSGFSVDLAKMIGQEIGVPIEFLDVPDTPSFIDAMVTGKVQMFPGIGKLPVLVSDSSFSETVVTDTLRFVVLEDNAEDLTAQGVNEKRLGIVPPALGSEETEILEKNTVIKYANPEAAVMGLLIGNVDALLIPNPVAYGIAKRARADGRIRFIGEPIREVDRVVSVHNKRAELMPKINDAIGKLEADGRLALLRQRYAVTVPPSPADVLTVGVAVLPPYNIQNDNGTFSGFSIELLKDLARLAGLKIQFKPISPKESESGPSSVTFDMLTPAVINDSRRQLMDFTLPVGRIDYSIFTLKENTENISDLDSLASSKLGVDSIPLAGDIDEKYGDLSLHTFDTGEKLLQALKSKQIDAILYPSSVMAAEIKQHGYSGQISEIDPPARHLEHAIALRFGLGQIRERLNAVIPGYLLSNDYNSLRQEYFGVPVFWNSVRIYAVLGLIATLLLATMGYLWWTKIRQRRFIFVHQQRALELERTHSEQLAKLVKNLELANREQAEFTYAVSHDLKSPSNTIGMLIQELAEVEGIGLEAKNVLNDMSATNERMRLLVDDVLVYSKIVDSETERVGVDLNMVVDNVRRDLSADIVEADATIMTSHLPSVIGQKTQLTMLLQNLIANAIKFRAPDRSAKVEITSESEPGLIRIVVSDNGIGIPKEFHDRVFGLFQRLHNRSKYDGTGLGLAICKRIMMTHNGQIHIGPGIAGGTAFILTFPGN